MEYTERQKRILREMAEREILKEGYRDRAIDLTTDAERLKVVQELPELEYDEDYNAQLAEALTLPL